MHMTVTGQQVTIGIVGAGGIVMKHHLPVLATMKEVKLSWIFDTDLRKARAAARGFGLEAAISLDSARNLPADVVLLGIPYSARWPFYDAFEGRALYVEKPLARTVKEHRSICDRFPEHRLACGLQQRMWGPVQLLRSVIDERLFGELRVARYGWGSPVTTLGSYACDVSMATGGILLESAIHGVDAVMFCSGAVSAQVRNARMIQESGFDIHSEAQVLLATKEGRTIECELCVSVLCETIQRLELVFDTATVACDLSGPPNITVRKGARGRVLSDARPRPFLSELDA